MGSRRHVRLSIVLAGDEPPAEFRLFAFGENETTKGTFLFDAAAAQSVMATYLEHGIDLMLDYDHASLAPVAPIPAEAGKAAGWFNLEVRAGELWAVNVRWTPPAAEALKNREWRFMSPAFDVDQDGRVTSVLNVAITNLPATHRLRPLMAAKATVSLGGCMLSPESVKKALDALTAGDAEAAMGILKDMIAEAAGGEAPAEDPMVDPPAEDLAEDPAPADEEKQAAVAAAIARLTRTTGKATIGAAVDEVEAWRLSHVKLEAETAKLAKERAALELGQRKTNAVTLTKLGAETPHTTGLAKGKLCKRLLDEPLDEQTARVTALLAARGGKLPNEVTPPANDETHGLSERELKMCADKKIDPAKYAKTRAGIAARSHNGTGV